MMCILGIIPCESKLYKALYSRWSIAAAAILTISWWIFRNIAQENPMQLFLK